MRPSETIEMCRRSHRLLLTGLAPLTDHDFASPSLLPGYTRGHVVTHLANKAKAHVLLLDGAVAGEVRRVHPEGYDPDLAADLGATRLADELRADVAEGFELLEDAWDALDDRPVGPAGADVRRTADHGRGRGRDRSTLTGQHLGAYVGA